MIPEAEVLLGLRVRSRRGTGVAALSLFVFYAITMSRSFSLYDSPELALVAEQLGLGHPLGQPLHTFLGAMAARLPGVDPLVALNGLSALFGALAVIPATSLAQTAIDLNRDDVDRAQRFVAPTVALIGALPFLWEPATRIEVYPLAVFCGLWALAKLAPILHDPEARAGVYFAAGCALGLSASTNPVCAAGAALGVAPVLIVRTAMRKIWPRQLLSLVFGGVLGLLPYAYVFAVASREDALVWGQPVDATSVRRYFTAADFAPKQVDSIDLWWGHVVDLGVWSLHNAAFAVVLAGFVGFLVFRQPSGFGISLLTITLSFFTGFLARNGVFAPDVLDYLGYLALPMWISAAGTGLLVARVALDRSGLALVLVGLIASLAIAVPPGAFDRTRRSDAYTEELAYQSLLAAPKDGILLVERDHWVGAIWYLQEQLGLRTDVVSIAYGLAGSSWYWAHVHRQHPGLAEFELRGEGGNPGRVERFLAANPNRPIQIERVELAEQLGLNTCPADWLLDVATSCEAATEPPAITRHAAEAMATLDDGSPGTDGLLALVAFDRGHDLWRHGLARSAVTSLLAGVPLEDGLDEVDLSVIPERVEPQSSPAPDYDPRTALGHPAKNLHYASLIARATHATDLAAYFETLAEALGPVTPKFTGMPSSPANL
ncbi:MAG: DUF2723 domain-containing protein [Myxococcota bacterium]